MLHAEMADAVIVGGGPSGLCAAEAIARTGLVTLVLERSAEIGFPIRTSGGSFIRELQVLGIPDDLYHPLRRCRVVSPGNSVTFDYTVPHFCVTDVRALYRYLATRAIEAGARIALGTTARVPIISGDSVTGVKVRSPGGREMDINCHVLVDAGGYKASMARKAGLHTGFKRFGVGTEYDFYAPNCDPDEAVLIVGNEFAPTGYAWIFPWGNYRVRVGVGILHPDCADHPDKYLEKVVGESSKLGIGLQGAQPLEHHFGLIPFDGISQRLVGNGIVAVGDAAGQPSAVAGEGIRWAIKAGRMAGSVVAEALSRGDCSRAALSRYERQWNARYGAAFRMARSMSRERIGWSDRHFDEGVEVLKLLTPEQFAQALQTNFTAGCLWRMFSGHSQAVRKNVRRWLEASLGAVLLSSH